MRAAAPRLRPSDFLGRGVLCLAAVGAVGALGDGSCAADRDSGGQGCGPGNVPHPEDLSVVFVCLRNPQPYLMHSARQLQAVGYGRIWLVAERLLWGDLGHPAPAPHEGGWWEGASGVRLFDAAELDDALLGYERRSGLDADFRGGFWRMASARFFVLLAFMQRQGVGDVLHLENDVLVYQGPAAVAAGLRREWLWAPLDSPQRAVASVVYVPSAALLEIALRDWDYGAGDMANLAQLRQQGLLRGLPLYDAPDSAAADLRFVSEHFGAFGGVLFDAAAAGQMVGGVDPRNAEGRDTRGFVNEQCAVRYGALRIFWRYDPGGVLRRPHLETPRGVRRLFNLHVHSKQLERYLALPSVPPASVPAATRPLRVELEGWFGAAHSYSVIATQLAYAWLSSGAAEVALRQAAPPPGLELGTVSLPGAVSAALARAPRADGPEQAEPWADWVLRVAYPFAFQRRRGPARYAVYATTEVGSCRAQDSAPPPAPAAPEAGGAPLPPDLVVTPSERSAAGLRAGCGLPTEARIAVVPNGFDAAVFNPVAAEARGVLRRRLRFTGRFVFAMVGAMTPNKGIAPALRAFAEVHRARPDRALLFLKGLDDMYSSAENVAKAARQANVNLEGLLESGAVRYYGKSVGPTDLANIYRAADVLLAPYVHEGFAMPVAEAAACGTPVVVTRGGPTDEFTEPSWAVYVDRVEAPEGVPQFHQPPEHAALVRGMKEVMDDDRWRAAAREAAPGLVRRLSWDAVAGQLLSLLRNTAQ